MLAVSRPQWVCPHSQRVCFHGLHFSGSRLLFRELSEAGPGLRALSRPKPLRFRFSGTPQRHRLGWACILYTSQVQVAQMIRCLASTVTPRLGVHLILSPGPSRSVFWVYNGRTFADVPCVSSGELISGYDPPSECQPSRIPRNLGQQ